MDEAESKELKEVRRAVADLAKQESKELQVIKKAIVGQLLLQGVQAGALADYLDMDAADFSRMFPAKKLLKGKSGK